MKQVIMIHLALILFVVDHPVAVRTSRNQGKQWQSVVNGNAKVHLTSGVGSADMSWLNMSAWRNSSQEFLDFSRFTPLAPEFVYHAEDAFFNAVIHSLGVKSGQPCVEAVGETQVGCLANCHCSWGRQCYPKFVAVNEHTLELVKMDDSSPHLRVNVGVCHTSIPLLCIFSVLCFLFLLMCIVSVRTYLRLKEGEDMPIQFGVAQPTKLAYPLPAPKVDGPATHATSDTADPCKAKVEVPEAAVEERKSGESDPISESTGDAIDPVSTNVSDSTGDAAVK
mmetsp:Transcript_91715/g.159080  ORF Transcript_91715/g.159080 Transcript_91715/m.159080 type:complete len:280 (-) Transcript_91715:50-889(-)